MLPLYPLCWVSFIPMACQLLSFVYFNYFDFFVYRVWWQSLLVSLLSNQMSYEINATNQWHISRQSQIVLKATTCCRNWVISIMRYLIAKTHLTSWVIWSVTKWQPTVHYIVYGSTFTDFCHEVCVIMQRQHQRKGTGRGSLYTSQLFSQRNYSIRSITSWKFTGKITQLQT
jgi:hypothetical protein